MNGGDGAPQVVFMGRHTVTKYAPRVERSSLNKITVSGANAADSLILRTGNDAELFNVAEDRFRYFLMSINLATSAFHVLVDGVDDENIGTKISVDDFLDFTHTAEGWSIGGFFNFDDNYLDGDLSEFYFSTEYNNFSIQANIDKFIDPTTFKPIDLGVDGSTPSGNAPLIYLPKGDPADNKGTGGNFTMIGSVELVEGPGV